jgi:hypothetical protein
MNTASSYGLLVSWTVLKNMLDRYVDLFYVKERTEPARAPYVGTYLTLLDPLMTKYDAWVAAPNDNTKALNRKDFEAVVEEIDIFYFLNDYDNDPGCQFNPHDPPACRNFTVYDYTTYYPERNRYSVAPNRQNLIQVRNLSQKVYSMLEDLKI